MLVGNKWVGPLLCIHKDRPHLAKGVCRSCYKRESWHQHPEWGQKRVERDRKLRKDTLLAYGGKCQCCGESELAFLVIDHINNDGAGHRKSLRNVNAVYRWLRDNNYPKDRFQCLCYNCNSAKQYNPGGCPHGR